MTLATVQTADTGRSGAGAIVTLGPGWGWTATAAAGGVVHVRGYVFDGTRVLERADAARHVGALFATPQSDTQAKTVLAQLAGHFALVIETPERVIATVDRIRSIPLTYAIRDGVTHIDDRATRLRDALGLGRPDLDPDQVLAAAMSGYTVGGSTLYRGLRDLRAGEALIVEREGTRTLRWFIYDAWRTEAAPAPEKRLSELHRFLIERLAASAAGRAICVPLSAGLDSRMIAAGLKEVGARDVRLFSYGRKGNHEALTAKAIAERLGLPWRFVPFTTASQAAMFADPEHREALWRTADACTAVPFEQDWRAIVELRRDGYIPADAVIVNGQSGDYITGNHAPSALIDAPPGESSESRREAVLRALLGKHYCLWSSLANARSDAVVGRRLLAEAHEAGASFGEAEALHGIHEMLEYQDRQAKYVVSGQRTYDALGLDWRLPLWDDELVLFFRRAPASLKRQQNLYRRVLMTDNWGGVFAGIPVNAKTITPAWIRPIRLGAKAAMAPFGRERWHDVERRLFAWWMDPSRVSTVVPYGRVVLDRRGARHAVSWLTERWLNRHGMAIDDLVAGASAP